MACTGLGSVVSLVNRSDITVILYPLAFTCMAIHYFVTFRLQVGTSSELHNQFQTNMSQNIVIRSPESIS